MSDARGSHAFGDALGAAAHLCGRVGDEPWAALLAGDRARWQQTGDAAHVRSRFGGMGSFNDLVYAGGRWPQADWGWINVTLDGLRSLIFTLANAHLGPTAWADAEAALRRSARPPGVAGAVCEVCGAAVVHEASLEHGVAAALVPPALAAAAAARTLSETVDAALARDVPGAGATRRALAEAVARAGWPVRPRTPEACPACGAGAAGWVHVSWRLAGDGALVRA